MKSGNLSRFSRPIRRAKFTVSAVVIAVGFLGSAAFAEENVWVGGHAGNIWEEARNWSKKRVPKETDDVVIPGDKPTVVISKDYELKNGVPVKAPKRVKSLELHEKVPPQGAAPLPPILISADVRSAEGETVFLRSAVDIHIIAKGNIVTNKRNLIYAGSPPRSRVGGTSGGSIILESLEGQISLRPGGVRIRAGNGVPTVLDPTWIPMPVPPGFPVPIATSSGPGGDIYLKAKTKMHVGSIELSAGESGLSVPAAGDPTTGGAIRLESEDRMFIQGVLTAGRAFIGTGGSIAIDCKDNIEIGEHAKLTASWAGGVAGVGGSITIKSSKRLRLDGNLVAGSASTGGIVLLESVKLQHTGMINAGNSDGAGNKGGDVWVRVTDDPDPKLGKVTAGEGSPKGDLMVNGNKIGFLDRVEANSVYVRASGGERGDATIAFFDGAEIVADSFVCLETEQGEIDFSLLSGDGTVVSVAPGGLVNLVGSLVVAGGSNAPPEQISPFIEGEYALSETGCMPELCFGDINADGVVDDADLSFLLAAWGTSNSLADINGDGIVGSADLSLLLAAWGLCPA
ncbi:MAG TPA: hypothetical protein PKC43_13270 [Phycisphaerales bacterium]|nr:hypothetical protein [Phycisphaerales bacterium]HMP38403.1 hypothetical protein [Phycisphaerales bacterium]